MNSTIYYDPSLTGSGKTYSTIDNIIKNTHERYIVAAPSLALVKEYIKLFNKISCTNFLLSEVTSNTSQEFNNTTSHLFDAIANADAKNIRVVITTHETLRLSFHAGIFNFTGWNLFIDECIDLVKTHQIDLTHSTACWFNDAINDFDANQFKNMSVISLSAELNDTVNDVIAGKQNDSVIHSQLELFSKLASSGYDVLSCNDDLVKLNRVAKGNYSSRTGSKSARMNCLSIVHKQTLQQFKTVTVLCALFEMTELYTALKLIGFDLKRRYMSKKQNISSKHKNGSRLTVHYYTTKRNSLHLLNSMVKGKSVEDTIIDNFIQNIGSNQFYYNANVDHRYRFNRFTAPYGVNPRTYQGALVAEIAGVNDYDDYDYAIYTTARNLDNTAATVYQNFGISREQIEQDRNFSTAYQFLSRSSIRDEDATSDVHFHVVDKVCAEFINSLFPGCKLVYHNIGLDNENSLSKLNAADKKFCERFRKEFKSGKTIFSDNKKARYIAIFDNAGFIEDELYTFIKSH